MKKYTNFKEEIHLKRSIDSGNLLQGCITLAALFTFIVIATLGNENPVSRYLAYLIEFLLVFIIILIVVPFFTKE